MRRLMVFCVRGKGVRLSRGPYISILHKEIRRLCSHDAWCCILLFPQLRVLLQDAGRPSLCRRDCQGTEYSHPTLQTLEGIRLPPSSWRASRRSQLMKVVRSILPAASAFKVHPIHKKLRASFELYRIFASGATILSILLEVSHLWYLIPNLT